MASTTQQEDTRDTGSATLQDAGRDFDRLTVLQDAPGDPLLHDPLLAVNPEGDSLIDLGATTGEVTNLLGDTHDALSGLVDLYAAMGIVAPVRAIKPVASK